MPFPAWRILPTDVLDTEKLADQAQTWAAEQRQRLADLWAQTQRQAVQALASQFPAQRPPDALGGDSTASFGAGRVIPPGTRYDPRIQTATETPTLGERAGQLQGALESVGRFLLPPEEERLAAQQTRQQALTALRTGDRQRAAELAGEEVERTVRFGDLPAAGTIGRVGREAVEQAATRLHPFSPLREGIERLYHETDPRTAALLATDYGGGALRGLNVATSPELALGQKGKGALIEFKDTAPIGARALQHKPGLEAVASTTGIPPEMEILGVQGVRNVQELVASITLRPGSTMDSVGRGRLRAMGWTVETLPDGSQVWRPPSRQAAPAVAEPTTPITEVAPTSPPVRPPTQPPAPPAQPPRPAPERAGNILLEKLPEGVRDVVQQTFEQAPEVMEAARRGVLDDATIRQMADEVGTTPEQFAKRWRPGQAANAETVLAMREALAAKTREVLTARDAVRQSDTTENLLRLRLVMEEQRAIQEAVSGVTAEAGRALRQFRQSVTGAIQSGDQQQMQKLLEKLGGREFTENLAQRLAQLDQNDPVAVMKFIRNATKPKLSDYVTELWYNSVLSGPRTHLRNALSNTVSAVLSPVERTLAAAADVPISRIQGRPRERFAREAAADAVGMLRGIPEGVSKALFVMRNGFSLDDAVRMDIRRTQAFRGPVGTVINLPSRALAASDVFFRSVLYRGALNAEAYRMARMKAQTAPGVAEEMAKLLDEPPLELLQRAGKIASYRVFQQEPGKRTRAFIRLRESVLPLRFIVPFVQTPTNLVKFGLERSPLAWFQRSFWRNLAQGNPEAAEQAARAFMGSMVAASIAALKASGQIDITGQAPVNPAERDRFYREGKQPFSIKVGDTWVSYQQMEPFNQTFAQMAAVFQALERGDKTATEQATQIGFTIGQNLLSATYMESISDFFNAMLDPQRYGSQVAQNFATGLVPFSGALRTAAQITDPTIRQPRGIAEALQAGIPGLSQNVPPRLTAFGEEATREAPLSPVNVSTATETPVDRELGRLGVEVGFVGKTLRGIDLNREEQQQYQRVAGQAIKRRLERLIQQPAYQRLSDDRKARLIERAVNQSRDNAARVYLRFLLRRLGRAEFQRRMHERQRKAG